MAPWLVLGTDTLMAPLVDLTARNVEIYIHYLQHDKVYIVYICYDLDTSITLLAYTYLGI